MYNGHIVGLLAHAFRSDPKSVKVSELLQMLSVDGYLCLYKKSSGTNVSELTQNALVCTLI